MSSQTAAGAWDEGRVVQRMSKDTKGLRTELVSPPTFTDQGEEGKPGRETKKHGRVRGRKAREYRDGHKTDWQVRVQGKKG